MKSRRKKSKLRIVVVLLAIANIFIFMMAYGRIRSSSSRSWIDYSANDYAYYAEDRPRIGYLFETAVDDMKRGSRYSTEVSEYRALAFYYEQALLEHAYRREGENEKADVFAKKKEKYESELGSLSGKTKIVLEAIPED